MEYMIDKKTMKLAYNDGLVVRAPADQPERSILSKGILPSPSHTYLVNFSKSTSSGLDYVRRFAYNLPISELSLRVFSTGLLVTPFC